jgi:class 3 adenylate cyclase
MKGASMAFRERQLVTVVVDLARFTQAVAGMDAMDMANLIDRFYNGVSTAIAQQGGRVVKYLGDGGLAVFPAESALRAVDAVEAIRGQVRDLAAEFALDLEMGANIHICTVAEGEFGIDDSYDVVGMGLVHTFRMGSGAGIRISEPVYRKLPSDRRGAWSKHQPPATYTYQPQ